MGIFEDIIANGLTMAWGTMSEAQRANILVSTKAGAHALATFNEVAADDQVSPDELEAAVREILTASDSITGKAIQAFIMSLFKAYF
jgi:uncharacterized tellurite resistance protein B-like protein